MPAPDIMVVDTRGLRCPLPVIRAEKQALLLKKGEGFALLANDPMSNIDIPLFCKKNGFALTCTREGDVFRFEIFYK
ncbi:hypothetical protein MNBD_ALPHA12-1837 [hydrothermal vent metagenome]|uniref:UPF0033 domain-containing protein n=1 Tax=hydrothermal vent metagenome TaxID=652676 RepID=A0A3B0TTE0_9ZZZZ